MCSLVKLIGIAVAHDGINQEQAPKQKYLGENEYPHSQSRANIVSM
jgi:hypothetical protein